VAVFVDWCRLYHEIFQNVDIMAIFHAIPDHAQ